MLSTYLISKSISKLIKDRLIDSAHDVADGGLFITLLESCMNKNLIPLCIPTFNRQDTVCSLLNNLIQNQLNDFADILVIEVPGI